MPARFHTDTSLHAGAELALPDNAARHVQVLRLQPGDAIILFDGRGGQWQAEVLVMERKRVTARLLAYAQVERELASSVTLALGMPANERMDGLVEKATELGAACIVPLLCERSVLRLAGERAERKAAHWQAIAVAACEQSGRNRVPQVLQPLALRAWLAGLAAPEAGACRWQLSLAPGAPPLAAALALQRAGAGAATGAGAGAHITLLSGPEGGLAAAEIALAEAAGFCPVSLGQRVLRADTAPLAALAIIGSLAG